MFALAMAAVALVLASLCWRLLKRARVGLLNAAIERERPEASREIREKDESEAGS